MRISFTITLVIERGGKSKDLLSRISWKRRKSQIKKRDRSVCGYCNEFSPNGVVDHIIPLSRGGTDKLSNLTWSCKDCNSSKGDKLLSEWSPPSGKLIVGTDDIKLQCRNSIIDPGLPKLNNPKKNEAPPIVLGSSGQRILLDRMIKYLQWAFANGWTRDKSAEFGIRQLEWAAIRDFVSRWDVTGNPLWKTDSLERLSEFIDELHNHSVIKYSNNGQ